MSQRSVYFPIVFHFHQPVDNFDSVIEECYQKSYEPLLNQIYNHPKVKFTLHFTGSLLRWFLEKKPDFKIKLLEMAKRGQIEVIGGGYYEPIFAIIPERDRLAQMKKLSDEVKKELGIEVHGAWLSERVWEPNYPSFIKQAGLNYVIVDDNHFKACGLKEDETFYTYSTEDSDNVIIVFPINERIRYLAPWRPAKETIEYLEKNADEIGNRIIVFISDAEKMGVWGTTHELCYIKGHPQEDYVPFIEALFSSLEKSNIIKTITLSEYINKYEARGLIYLPTASYDKMEEWVLPTSMRVKFESLKAQVNEDIANWRFPPNTMQFLKGGFWRYFLVKYPESNNMHKRMYYVRNRLIKVEELASHLIKLNKVDKIKTLSAIETAWDEIYKSQCNDCYWHGQFGGVYIHFFRHGVYEHLNKAEKIMDQLENLWNAKNKVSISLMDFDKDTQQDLIVRTDNLFIFFKLTQGGVIYELDYKPNNYNVLNVLTRWLEAYHKSGEIPVDRYRKGALRDHFVPRSITLQDYYQEKYDEFGDFVHSKYDASFNQEGDIISIRLKRTGCITINDLLFEDITLEKTIFINSDSSDIEVEYTLSWPDPDTEPVLLESLKSASLIIEIPFMLTGDIEKFKCIADGKDIPPLENMELHFREITFIDETLNQNFTVSISSDIDKNNNILEAIFKYQIIAYARSNDVYKNTYQGLDLGLKCYADKLLNKKLKFKIKLS